MSRLGFFRLTTPDGPFIAILAGLAEDSPVVASGWAATPRKMAETLREPIFFEDGELLPDLVNPPWHLPPTCFAARAVAAYYEGNLTALDQVPVLIDAAPFLSRARTAMRRIPPGETWTYARLATAAGSPRAIRAAGAACSRNPTSLFVPCHRVVPSSGGIGAFGWGVGVKASLLAHEQGHEKGEAVGGA